MEVRRAQDRGIGARLLEVRAFKLYGYMHIIYNIYMCSLERRRKCWKCGMCREEDGIDVRERVNNCTINNFEHTL